jgi:hypothetical protein
MLIPLTEDQIKKEMTQSFTKINLDCYNDLLRIKKPQPQAMTACQMLCRMVSAFRGGQTKARQEEQFTTWKEIVYFVHKKPNVTKFNQEISQLIQHMILSPEYLKQLKNNQLKNHVNKLIKIQQQYFGTETLHQVSTHFRSSKNMLTFVRLVFTVIRYVLFQTGLHDLINMQTVRDHKDLTEYDSKSQNSFTSAKRSFMEGSFMRNTFKETSKY